VGTQNAGWKGIYSLRPDIVDVLPKLPPVDVDLNAIVRRDRTRSEGEAYRNVSVEIDIQIKSSPEEVDSGPGYAQVCGGFPVGIRITRKMSPAALGEQTTLIEITSKFVRSVSSPSQIPLKLPRSELRGPSCNSVTSDASRLFTTTCACFHDARRKEGGIQISWSYNILGGTRTPYDLQSLSECISQIKIVMIMHLVKRPTHCPVRLSACLQEYSTYPL
jgi:hypothetical protein